MGTNSVTVEQATGDRFFRGLFASKSDRRWRKWVGLQAIRNADRDGQVDGKCPSVALDSLSLNRRPDEREGDIRPCDNERSFPVPVLDPRAGESTVGCYSRSKEFRIQTLMPSDGAARTILRARRLLQHCGIETPVDFALVGWITIGLERGDQSAQSWR